MNRVVIRDNPAWQRLLRHVELSDAPQHRSSGYLILLVPDVTVAGACRKDLEAFLTQSSASLLVLPLETPDALAQVAVTLRHLQVPNSTGAVWVESVAGEWEDQFKNWRDAWVKAAVGMNRSRDTLLREIPAPIVLAGAPWLADVLITHAPDLWSARSLVVNVAIPAAIPFASGMPENPVETYSGDPKFAVNQVNAVRGVPGKEHLLAELLTRAAGSLLAVGQAGEAGKLAQEATQICIATSSDSPVSAMYQLASLNYRLGRWQEAMQLYKKYEEVCIQTGNRLGFGDSLGGQALVMLSWGRPSDALSLLAKQETVYSELNDDEGLQSLLGNRGLALAAASRWEEALTAFRVQQSICEKRHDRAALGRSYKNHSLVLIQCGRLEEAAALLQKAESIASELGDTVAMQDLWGNRAALLQQQGHLEEAISLFEREQSVAQARGDLASIGRNLTNQAALLLQMGRTQEAEDYLRRAEGIFTGLQMARERAIVEGWKLRLTEARASLPA